MIDSFLIIISDGSNSLLFSLVLFLLLIRIGFGYIKNM